jgi:hypothetical protein
MKIGVLEVFFLIKGRFDFGSPPFGFAFKAMHFLSLNVTISELVGNGYPLDELQKKFHCS